jgi:hypothetical protein
VDLVPPRLTLDYVRCCYCDFFWPGLAELALYRASCADVEACPIKVVKDWLAAHKNEDIRRGN